MSLTHFDAEGHAHMVDVSDKAVTDRIAVARAHVTMKPETLALVTAGIVFGVRAAARAPVSVAAAGPLTTGSGRKPSE